MEVDELHAKDKMSVTCGSTIPILGSMGTAKMRGYQVIGHNDPEVSHSLAKMGEEHGKETFGVMYLK